MQIKVTRTLSSIGKVVRHVHLPMGYRRPKLMKQAILYGLENVPREGDSFYIHSANNHINIYQYTEALSCR
jgi:hypothetical protein